MAIRSLLSSNITKRFQHTLQVSDVVSSVSRILSDNRNPQDDLETPLNELTHQITPLTALQILKRCKNLPHSALRFFNYTATLPNFHHNPETLSVTLNLLAQNQLFSSMWDFLLTLSKANPHIPPNLFSVIFRSYAKANLPHEAVRAFYRMREFGIEPSKDDVHVLLFTLCKRKHVRVASEFFYKVKDEFQLGVKSYSILIRGWGDIMMGGKAKVMFEEMCRDGIVPDVLAYNSLLDALCKVGSFDEADKVFHEMGLRDAGSYGVFVRAYCENGDVESVFRVIETVRRRGLVLNLFTWNCVVKTLCKKGRVDEAYKVLEGMVEVDSWSYNAILAYHCERSEVNSALRLVSRMVEEGKCMPDKHSYNMVLKLLVRVGRFDRANEVWETMGGRGFYPSVSTYTVMIHELSKKKGKLEEACKYFEMMVDEGIPPYSTTVEMLRNRLIGLGFSDVVDILADKMGRSTCCKIKEMANLMKGNRANAREKPVETDYESD